MYRLRDFAEGKAPGPPLDNLATQQTTLGTKPSRSLNVGALLAAPFPRNHTRLPFAFTPISREAIVKQVIWVASAILLVTSWGFARGAANPVAPSVPAIDGRIGVAAAVALADDHIQCMVHSIELLAMTEEVRSGRWEKMRGLLTKFKEVQIPAVVFFALPDGSYYTVDKGKTDQNLKDRAYFRKVMAGEKAIGDLVVSRSTGKKVVVAAVPIKKGEKVIGVLGVSIHLDRLSERLAQELQLPQSMVVYAIDPKQGYVALHSVTKFIFEEPRKTGSETLRMAVKEMLSREEGVVTYDLEGVEQTAVFKASPLTGWRFALAGITEQTTQQTIEQEEQEEKD